jgi:hypothetical protein
MEGKLSEATIASSTQGKALLKVRDLLTGKSTDVAIVIDNAEEVFGEQGSPAFLKDLRAIQAYEKEKSNLEKAKLELTASFNRKLDRMLKKIQAEIAELQKQTWSHEKWASLGRKALVDQCDVVVAKLNEITIPSDEAGAESVKEALGKIIQTVRSWKDGLLPSAAPATVNERKTS